MTQDVDPQVIKQAAAAWRQLHDEAAAAVTGLAGVLQASAGMAGTDNGAHAWASKYDLLCGGCDGATGVIECASAAVIAAGQVTDLLYATAVNHENADHNPHLIIRGRQPFRPRESLSSSSPKSLRPKEDTTMFLRGGIPSRHMCRANYGPMVTRTSCTMPREPGATPPRSSGSGLPGKQRNSLSDESEVPRDASRHHQLQPSPRRDQFRG